MYEIKLPIGGFSNIKEKAMKSLVLLFYFYNQRFSEVLFLLLRNS
jgi:hypothetical protein